MRTAFLFLILSYFTCSCKEEKMIDPAVEITSINNFGPGLYHGEARIIQKGDYPVKEVGFAFLYDRIGPIGTTRFPVSLDSVRNDTFSTVVTLTADEYSRNPFIVAYITNTRGTVFSKTQLQSLPVFIIDSVTPAAAERGDTIKICGKNLQSVKESDTILIGSTHGRIVEISSSVIKAIIPSGVVANDPTCTFPVSLISYGYKRLCSYIIVIPTFTSMSPESGIFQTVVAIQADNLTGSRNDYSVWFGETKGIITYKSGNELAVAVPYNAKSKELIVRLGVQDWFSRTSANFRMNDLKIDSIVPNKAVPGTSVVVYGTNLNPSYQMNFVIIGGQGYQSSCVDIGKVCFSLPSLAPGQYDVSVFNNVDKAVLTKGFEVLPY
jgi:hypothetical protein